PHYGQIGLDLVCSGQHAGEALRVASHARGFLADASVPGQAIDPCHSRRLAQIPYQRMLPSPSANHQDLHKISVFPTAWKSQTCEDIAFRAWPSALVDRSKSLSPQISADPRRSVVKFSLWTRLYAPTALWRCIKSSGPPSLVAICANINARNA